MLDPCGENRYNSNACEEALDCSLSCNMQALSMATYKINAVNKTIILQIFAIVVALTYAVYVHVLACDEKQLSATN